MRFSIRHLTKYTYSRPVFVEPHLLRLRPREDGTQRLIRFEMAISPAPVGQSEGLDAEGNALQQVWFSGVSSALEICTVIEVQTLRGNPFDFYMDPQAELLNSFLDSSTRNVLAPCLQRSGIPHGAAQDPVARLAGSLAERVQSRTGPFLNALTEHLYANIERIERHEQDIFPAVATLASGRGACRDIAVLFVDACRSVGLPARFVSGFQEGDPASSKRELHAWAEVYLAGGGWRGYDPTQGLAVADRHVILAASAEPQLAAPVTGSFRGTDASSLLETHITLQTSPSENHSNSV